MSSDEEELEEEKKSAFGEGEAHHTSYVKLIIEEEIIPKSLTFLEASKCLHMLGKDESGIRYAYLMITALHMKLTEVSVILNFTHVLFLDLTGNKLSIESLRCLTNMPYLLYLKVAENIIESCDLESMFYLQVLNFSKNKILDTHGIKQPMLECLDLNYNYIENVHFQAINTTEDPLPNLKILEIRRNLIGTLSGIYPPSIAHLYLAENQIGTIEPNTLDPLVNLKTLHLRDNLLRKLNGFSPKLVNLQYLNVRTNKIMKMRQLAKLACLPTLHTLIVMGNPICKEEEKGGEGADEEDDNEDMEEEEELDQFRLAVLVLLPSLKRINKKIVRVEERIAADGIREGKWTEIMAEESSSDELPADEEEEERFDPTAL